MLGEGFQIALNERQKQVRIQKPYGTGTDLEPSGRLRLRIGSPTTAVPRIATIRHVSIEDLLNRFIAELVRQAVAAQRNRAIQAGTRTPMAVDDTNAACATRSRHSEELRRRRLRVLASRWV